VVLAAIAALAIASAAIAGETGVFAGAVHDASGKAIVGAMVTFTNRSLRRGTTVFADAQGRFRLPALEAGTYDLRVRRAGYEDLQDTGLTLGDGTTRLDLKLDPATDPRELAWELPANRWLPLVLARLSSDSHREEFTRQCAYCHQQGAWGTRVQRSHEDWEAIFDRMARMGGGISKGLRAELPDALNAAFDENSYVKALTEPEFVPPPAPEGPAASAVITEWDLGVPTSMLHDIAVYPDGTVWAVDTSNDALYHLDPRTSARERIAIPTGDSPIGGVFHSAGLLQNPGAVARVAPHSLQVASDGTIWVTLCLGDKVGHFDPRTQKWTIYKQKSGLYPHTLRIDRKGRVWYTLAVSNDIGMIDPSTGEQRVFHLPAPTMGQAIATRALPFMLWVSNHLHISPGSSSGGEGASLPVPYGIDIAPDGGVWFSQLNAKRIGRLDPDTGEIKIIETPFAGPRRLRFDSKGNLWIPGFSSDLLARYTPATGEFKTWKLPTRGIETPYALNVDRRTDTVWICGTASDTLISFDPMSERFTVYRLPTRVSFTREIDFDKDGAIWTSDSNFPAWQIEAANPRVIRLQPAAAPKPD
jgi:virginiamycin B lyase